MVFRIAEQFWCWGNDFSISDAGGRPAYRVDGKVFSWGDSLSFQTPDGSEIAQIRQTMLSFKPRYQIIIDGQAFAEVVKEWTWFKKRFTLDVPGPNDYTIDGSFWEHEFSFSRSGRNVATVSKKLWSWTDSYGVEIADTEDVVPILCTCIVIDQVLHNESARD